MEEWEYELRNVLSGVAAPADGRIESLRKEIVEAFARKERKIRYILYAYMAALLAGFIFFTHQYWQAGDLKAALWNGILAIIMIEGTILIKLWYWIINTRIATARDIKQLQLQVAELAGRKTDAA